MKMEVWSNLADILNWNLFWVNCFLYRRSGSCFGRCHLCYGFKNPDKVVFIFKNITLSWSHPPSALGHSARSSHLSVVRHLRNPPRPLHRCGRRSAELLAGWHHQRAAAEGRLVVWTAQRDAGMVPQNLCHFGACWELRVWNKHVISV